MASGSGEATTRRHDAPVRADVPAAQGGQPAALLLGVHGADELGRVSNAGSSAATSVWHTRLDHLTPGQGVPSAWRKK